MNGNRNEIPIQEEKSEPAKGTEMNIADVTTHPPSSASYEPTHLSLRSEGTVRFETRVIVINDKESAIQGKPEPAEGKEANAADVTTHSVDSDFHEPNQSPLLPETTEHVEPHVSVTNGNKSESPIQERKTESGSAAVVQGKKKGKKKKRAGHTTYPETHDVARIQSDETNAVLPVKTSDKVDRETKTSCAAELGEDKIVLHDVTTHQVGSASHKLNRSSLPSETIVHSEPHISIMNGNRNEIPIQEEKSEPDKATEMNIADVTTHPPSSASHDSTRLSLRSEGTVRFETRVIVINDKESAIQGKPEPAEGKEANVADVTTHSSDSAYHEPNQSPLLFETTEHVEPHVSVIHGIESESPVQERKTESSSVAAVQVKKKEKKEKGASQTTYPETHDVASIQSEETNAVLPVKTTDEGDLETKASRAAELGDDSIAFKHGAVRSDSAICTDKGFDNTPTPSIESSTIRTTGKPSKNKQSGKKKKNKKTPSSRPANVPAETDSCSALRGKTNDTQSSFDINTSNLSDGPSKVSYSRVVTTKAKAGKHVVDKVVANFSDMQQHLKPDNEHQFAEEQDDVLEVHLDESTEAKKLAAKNEADRESEEDINSNKQVKLKEPMMGISTEVSSSPSTEPSKLPTEAELPIINAENEIIVSETVLTRVCNESLNQVNGARPNITMEETHRTAVVPVDEAKNEGGEISSTLGYVTNVVMFEETSAQGSMCLDTDPQNIERSDALLQSTEEGVISTNGLQSDNTISEIDVEELDIDDEQVRCIETAQRQAPYSEVYEKWTHVHVQDDLKKVNDLPAYIEISQGPDASYKANGSITRIHVQDHVQNIVAEASAICALKTALQNVTIKLAEVYAIATISISGFSSLFIYEQHQQELQDMRALWYANKEHLDQIEESIQSMDPPVAARCTTELMSELQKVKSFERQVHEAIEQKCSDVSSYIQRARQVSGNDGDVDRAPSDDSGEWQKQEKIFFELQKAFKQRTARSESPWPVSNNEEVTIIETEVLDRKCVNVMKLLESDQLPLPLVESASISEDQDGVQLLDKLSENALAIQELLALSHRNSFDETNWNQLRRLYLVFVDDVLTCIELFASSSHVIFCWSQLPDVIKMATDLHNNEGIYVLLRSFPSPFVEHIQQCFGSLHTLLHTKPMSTSGVDTSPHFGEPTRTIAELSDMKSAWLALIQGLPAYSLTDGGSFTLPHVQSLRNQTIKVVKNAKEQLQGLEVQHMLSPQPNSFILKELQQGIESVELEAASKYAHFCEIAYHCSSFFESMRCLSYATNTFQNIIAERVLYVEDAKEFAERIELFQVHLQNLFSSISAAQYYFSHVSNFLEESVCLNYHKVLSDAEAVFQCGIDKYLSLRRCEHQWQELEAKVKEIEEPVQEAVNIADSINLNSEKDLNVALISLSDLRNIADSYSSSIATTSVCMININDFVRCTALEKDAASVQHMYSSLLDALLIKEKQAAELSSYELFTESVRDLETWFYYLQPRLMNIKKTLLSDDQPNTESLLVHLRIVKDLEHEFKKKISLCREIGKGFEDSEFIEADKFSEPKKKLLDQCQKQENDLLDIQTVLFDKISHSDFSKVVSWLSQLVKDAIVSLSDPFPVTIYSGTEIEELTSKFETIEGDLSSVQPLLIKLLSVEPYLSANNIPQHSGDSATWTFSKLFEKHSEAHVAAISCLSILNRANSFLSCLQFELLELMQWLQNKKKRLKDTQENIADLGNKEAQKILEDIELTRTEIKAKRQFWAEARNKAGKIPHYEVLMKNIVDVKISEADDLLNILEKLCANMKLLERLRMWIEFHEANSNAESLLGQKECLLNLCVSTANVEPVGSLLQTVKNIRDVLQDKGILQKAKVCIEEASAENRSFALDNAEQLKSTEERWDKIQNMSKEVETWLNELATHDVETKRLRLWTTLEDGSPAEQARILSEMKPDVEESISTLKRFESHHLFHPKMHRSIDFYCSSLQHLLRSAEETSASYLAQYSTNESKAQEHLQLIHCIDEKLSNSASEFHSKIAMVDPEVSQTLSSDDCEKTLHLLKDQLMDTAGLISQLQITRISLLQDVNLEPSILIGISQSLHSAQNFLLETMRHYFVISRNSIEVFDFERKCSFLMRFLQETRSLLLAQDSVQSYESLITAYVKFMVFGMLLSAHEYNVFHIRECALAISREMDADQQSEIHRYLDEMVQFWNSSKRNFENRLKETSSRMQLWQNYFICTSHFVSFLRTMKNELQLVPEVVLDIYTANEHLQAIEANLRKFESFFESSDAKIRNLHSDDVWSTKMFLDNFAFWKHQIQECQSKFLEKKTHLLRLKDSSSRIEEKIDFCVQELTSTDTFILSIDLENISSYNQLINISSGIKKEKDRLEEVSSSLQDVKKEMDQLQENVLVVSSIAERYPFVRDKHSDLCYKTAILHNAVQERINQFSEIFALCLRFHQWCEIIVRKMKNPSNMPLHKMIEYWNSELKKDIETESIHCESVSSLGQQLLPMLGEDTQKRDELSRSLDAIQSDKENVWEVWRQQLSKMERVIHIKSELEHRVEEVSIFLGSMEERLASVGKGISTISELADYLSKINTIIHDVEAREETVNAMKNLHRDLLAFPVAFYCDAEGDALLRSCQMLEMRFRQIRTLLLELIIHIQETERNWELIASLLRPLENWLEEMDSRAPRSEDFLPVKDHNTATHREFLEELESSMEQQELKWKEVNDKYSRFSVKYTAIGKDFSTRVEDVNNKWNRLKDLLPELKLLLKEQSQDIVAAKEVSTRHVQVEESVGDAVEDIIAELQTALEEAEIKIREAEEVLRSTTPTGVNGDQPPKDYAQFIATCTSSIDLLYALNGMISANPRLTRKINELFPSREGAFTKLSNVKENMESKSRRFNEKKEKWHLLLSQLSNTESWLEGAESKTFQWETADIQRLDSLFIDHKELLSELWEQKKIISSFNELIRESPNLPQNQAVSPAIKRFQAVNDKYEQLHRQAIECYVGMRSRLLQSSEFNDAISELLDWLKITELQVNLVLQDAEIEDSDITVIQYKKLMELKNELELASPRIEFLQRLSNHLSQSTFASSEISWTIDDDASVIHIRKQLDDAKDHIDKLLRLCNSGVEKLSGFLGSEERLSLGRDSVDGASPIEDKDEAAESTRSGHCYAYLMRVARASFPIQALLLLLLGAAAILPVSEDELNCQLVNNFAQTFDPMLRYSDGPPPV